MVSEEAKYHFDEHAAEDVEYGAGAPVADAIPAMFIRLAATADFLGGWDQTKNRYHPDYVAACLVLIY